MTRAEERAEDPSTVLPTLLLATFLPDFSLRDRPLLDSSLFGQSPVVEHIKYRIETTHRCEIHPIHFNTFKVDDKWKETAIDLAEHSCSYRQWDLDELSCFYQWLKGVSINALASDLYTTEFLKHDYEMGVNPVLNPKF
ncbi:hypothetical protein Ddye_021139 [Dipteronia dyeriana]|uniref:Uncharacterized protein n=1 Tax=Dipteronia dyeriana TaxID=168575 RepID=A0AAD9WW20_9ROSI|nr:hypothetical protein Ddye_021139 [Dipteronia dyeriana]